MTLRRQQRSCREGVSGDAVDAREERERRGRACPAVCASHSLCTRHRTRSRDRVAWTSSPLALALQRLFGVNNFQGVNGVMQNAQVQPTFGLSFGLPNQGAAGLYPLAGHGPFPLGNPAVQGGGIDLGPIAVNPLVSVQVTKDQYGGKVVKPFVNLHVTPNPYLVTKFLHSLHDKHNKINHYHKHYYNNRPYGPHGPHYYKPGYGRPPPFVHGPSYAPDYHHGYRTDDVLVGPGGPGGPGLLVGPGYPGNGPAHDFHPHDAHAPLVGPDYPSHGPGPLVGPDYPSHGPDYPAHGHGPLVGPSYPSDGGYPNTYAPSYGGFGEPPVGPDTYRPGGGYVSDSDDQYAGIYRSNYNRSLSFPGDGSASDPPRPPQYAPLPLAKSDASAVNKPVVFPSDRRSDRRRREVDGGQDTAEVQEGGEEGRSASGAQPEKVRWRCRRRGPAAGSVDRLQGL